MKDRCKLDYDSEMFALAKDHYLLHFRAVVDYDVTLKGGPWFVAGQLLAMKVWKPNFVSKLNTIRRTVVWLRLPNLPIEY